MGAGDGAQTGTLSGMGTDSIDTAQVTQAETSRTYDQGVP